MSASTLNPGKLGTRDCKGFLGNPDNHQKVAEDRHCAEMSRHIISSGQLPEIQVQRIHVQGISHEDAQKEYLSLQQGRNNNTCAGSPLHGAIGDCVGPDTETMSNSLAAEQMNFSNGLGTEQDGSAEKGALMAASMNVLSVSLVHSATPNKVVTTDTDKEPLPQQAEANLQAQVSCAKAVPIESAKESTNDSSVCDETGHSAEPPTPCQSAAQHRVPLGKVATDQQALLAGDRSMRHEGNLEQQKGIPHPPEQESHSGTTSTPALPSNQAVMNCAALAKEVKQLEEELKLAQEALSGQENQLKHAESYVADLQAEVRAVTEAYTSIRSDAETSKDEIEQLRLEIEALGGGGAAKKRLDSFRQKIEREVQDHLQGRIARAESAIETERAHVLTLEHHLQESHQAAVDGAEALKQLDLVREELEEAGSTKKTILEELNKERERRALLESQLSQMMQEREEQQSQQECVEGTAESQAQEIDTLTRELKELRESHKRLLVAAKAADDRAMVSDVVAVDTKMQVQAAATTIEKLLEENASLNCTVNRQGKIVEGLQEEIQTLSQPALIESDRSPSMDNPSASNDAPTGADAVVLNKNGGAGRSASNSVTVSLPDPPSSDAGSNVQLGVGGLSEQEMELVALANEIRRLQNELGEEKERVKALVLETEELKQQQRGQGGPLSEDGGLSPVAVGLQGRSAVDAKSGKGIDSAGGGGINSVVGQGRVGQEKTGSPAVLQSTALTPVSPVNASARRRWSWDFGLWRYLSGADLVRK